MNHFIKNIFKFVLVSIPITILLCMIIIAIIKKDYLELIRLISIIVGFALFEIVDANIIKVLRKRTKQLDFFNSMIWIIYIIFFIVSALEGLWIATLPFCKRYWNI